MVKRYRAGMYGGKFMPMHLGHLYCLRKASELCDRVYLILFYGGNQEEDILRRCGSDLFTVENRMAQVRRAASGFDNVEPLFIDVSSCRFPDGSEDWDAETPLVLNACGHFDAVFGSEPGYAPYFARAYPWAEYIMIDAARTVVPISATAIRKMNNTEEIKKWIV